MEYLRDAFAEYLTPLTVVGALAYIIAAYALGADPRWAWFAFPAVFAVVFWRQGRTAVVVPYLVYLAAYAYLVGFGTLQGAQGLGAAALPAGCVIVQIVALIIYWTGHHIKHAR
jgi:hypothetical protein